MTLKRKFEVAYFIAKENLEIRPLCELEQRHGVDLGEKYKSNCKCAEFVEFIAGDIQQQLPSSLQKAKFFSIRCDRSTDAEEELYLVLYFDASSNCGKVYVRNNFFTVQQLRSGSGKGLFECLEGATEYMSIANWRHKLVGLGCDGTNANVVAGGLRGFLQEVVPSAVVFWCLAHRLELTLKDALNKTFFSTIDELLLQMYMLYQKSPKKCKELEDVVQELKSCLEPADMPEAGGSRPLRACGTRFVSHKVSALGRLIDRFGAYLSHLASLVEDTSIRGTDRQRLKGYLEHRESTAWMCLLCRFAEASISALQGTAGG